MAALVSIVVIASRPASAPAGASGSSANSQVAGQNQSAPADGTSKEPAQTSFDFGWVDANDRRGNQLVEVGVVDFVNGKPDFATNQEWQKGKRYDFQANLAAIDTRTNKPLAGWGFSYTIFNEQHEAIDRGTGTLNSGGGARINFSITPAAAGVYRLRVAVGDGVDEDAVVFHMPASTSYKDIFGA